MAEASGPAVCEECGGAWVFRAPWWARPSPNPEWGYLLHCAHGHFKWFPAELDEEERAAAVARFLDGSGIRDG